MVEEVIMKKYGLFKVILIILGLLVVTSIFIPGRDGDIAYIPIGDEAINFVQAFYYFFDTVVYLLVLGAFYGVLNLVPAYKKLLDNIAQKVKSHSKGFIFITAIVFAILTSLFGIDNCILVFVPFIISIILLLGYDKLVAISSTVVAMLIGFMGGIFTTFRDPNNYYGYSSVTIDELAGLDKYTNLWPRLILVILGIALLIFFINRHIKNVQEKKVKYELNDSDDLLVSEVKGDYKNIKTWPLMIILSLILIVLVFGYFPWNNLFGIEVFNNFHQNLLEFRFNFRSVFIVIGILLFLIIVWKFIKKKHFDSKDWVLNSTFLVIFLCVILSYIPLGFLDKFHDWFTAKNLTLNSIISNNLYALGNWSSLGSFMGIIIVLLVFTLVTKIIYRIKFDDVIDGFVEGSKRMLPAVFLMILSYTILICTYNNGLISTIITWISESSLGLNVVTTSFVSALGSLLHVDLYYTAAGVFSPILSAATDESLYSVYAMTFQSIHGLISIIGPTSFLLIVVLTYFDVPYTTWVKYIWRFVLMLLLLVILVLLVLSLI